MGLLLDLEPGRHDGPQPRRACPWCRRRVAYRVETGGFYPHRLPRALTPGHPLVAMRCPAAPPSDVFRGAAAA